MPLFATRLRKVGNSLGVLVPKEALDAMDAHEGDDVEVVVVPPAAERRRRLLDAVGSVPGLVEFQRDRRDRF